MQQQNGSEVARLRAQIEREHESMCFAVTGPALGAAKHWFITRRMEVIGTCQQQLARLVGEQASMQIVLQVMENSPEQKRESTPHE